MHALFIGPEHHQLLTWLSSLTGLFFNVLVVFYRSQVWLHTETTWVNATAHLIGLSVGSNPRPNRGIVKSVEQTWGISPGVGESCKTKSHGWGVFQQKISLPSPSHMKRETFFSAVWERFQQIITDNNNMVIVRFIRSPEVTPIPVALILVLLTVPCWMINHTCKTDQKNPDKEKVMQSIDTISKRESNKVFTAGIKDKWWPFKTRDSTRFSHLHFLHYLVSNREGLSTSL